MLVFHRYGVPAVHRDRWHLHPSGRTRVNHFDEPRHRKSHNAFGCEYRDRPHFRRSSRNSCERKPRILIADEFTGSGPTPQWPISPILDGDQILLLDNAFGALVSIDLLTGDRKVIINTFVGTGPELRLPSDWVIDGRRVLILDRELRSIIALDLTTGNRTVISGDGVGQGPQLENSSVLVRDGSRLLVGKPRGMPFFVVDMITGERVSLAKSN